MFTRPLKHCSAGRATGDRCINYRSFPSFIALPRFLVSRHSSGNLKHAYCSILLAINDTFYITFELILCFLSLSLSLSASISLSLSLSLSQTYTQIHTLARSYARIQTHILLFQFEVSFLQSSGVADAYVFIHTRWILGRFYTGTVFEYRI